MTSPSPQVEAEPVARLRQRVAAYTRLLEANRANSSLTKIHPSHLEGARNELSEAADLLAVMLDEREALRARAENAEAQLAAMRTEPFDRMEMEGITEYLI